MIVFLNNYLRKQQLQRVNPYPHMQFTKDKDWPESCLKQMNFDFKKITCLFQNSQKDERRAGVFDYYHKPSVDEDGSKRWESASLVDIRTELSFGIYRNSMPMLPILENTLRGAASQAGRECVELSKSYSLYFAKGHDIATVLLDALVQFLANDHISFVELRPNFLVVNSTGRPFWPESRWSVSSWLWWILETGFIARRQYANPSVFWDLLASSISLAELIEAHGTSK